MKKILILLCCLILTGCSKSPENTNIVQNVNKQVQEINKNDSSFIKSAKLIDSIYNDKNIMISPLSLDIALAMTANGAENETLQEIENFLGKNINAYNEFIKNYTSVNNNINLANSIWIDNNYTLNQEFKEKMNKYYDAIIESLDFSDTKSLDVINNWVNTQTNNKIPKVLNELNPEATNILINVVDFEQEWDENFEAYDIRKDIFHGTKLKSSQKFLTDENSYTYYENEYAYGFKKDYKDKKYSFIAILPKEKGDFNVNDLDLDNLLKNKSKEMVYFELPEFEFDCTLDIKENLISLGLKEPFSNEADYFGIVNERDLKIDSIIQKTKVKVDRSGTKASAVTVIQMVENSAPNEIQETKRVILNRPFLFMIFDNEFDIPVFIGKVVNL